MENRNYYSLIEAITPEIAKEYLAKNTENRPVRKNIVAFYADQMKRGQWKMNGESICFTADGSLADGQHRLHAIIESGVTILTAVVRGCDEGSFPTYDSGINRTTADVFFLSHIVDGRKKSSAISRYHQIMKKSRFIRVPGEGAIGMSNKNLKISRQDLLDTYFANKSLIDDVVRMASRNVDRLKVITETEMAGTALYLIKDMMWPAQTVYKFFEELTTIAASEYPIVDALRDMLVKDKVNNSVKMSGAQRQSLLIKAWNKYSSGSGDKRLRYNVEYDGKIWFARNDKLM